MSRAKKRLSIFLILSIVVLMMMTYQYKHQGNKQLIFRETITYPFNAINSLIDSVKKALENHWNAVKENERLKREISMLLLEMQGYKEIVKENERLREILSLKPQIRNYIAVARVISQGHDRLMKTIILDKGIKDGILKDMTVITTKGLVGKVYRTQESFSEVLLINDANFSVAVRLQNARQESILSGIGRSYCILKYVPFENIIEKGEVVVTSGLDGVIPPNIPVGTVIDVKKDETDFFQEIKVMPFQSMDKIEEVVVLKR